MFPSLEALCQFVGCALLCHGSCKFLISAVLIALIIVNCYSLYNSVPFKVARGIMKIKWQPLIGNRS